MKHDNPFAQQPVYWQVVFKIPSSAAGTAETAFDDLALAVSGFQTDEAAKIWTFELLLAAVPDKQEVYRRLLVIAKLHGVAIPEVEIQRIEQRDWLAQVARSFPPLSIGPFYVHGSHVETPPPAGRIAIRIDAGAAFGSGEHGTTRCCLEALDWLSKRRNFRHILDMGCGSGILAIAAAGLWKTRILAADIDPVAVRVTQENARVNRVHHLVSASVSDGYSAVVRRPGGYDLIVSNILARPLVKFAPDLAACLAPHGVAVLSGLLVSQEQQVLAAHLAQGLRLRRRFTHEDWCTLVLTGKGAI